MSLIDYTYFQKRITAIPNLNQEAVRANLDDNINIYEDEYLVNVLGQDLKDEFISGLEAVTPEAKWLALRDGATFTYCGSNYKWKGFVRDTKESPIAFYVMWYFVRENNEQFTGIAVTTSDVENAFRQSPYRIMVNVWNRMVYDNRILEKFLLSQSATYVTYMPIDTLTENSNYYGI